MPPIPAPRESGFTTTTPVPLYWCAYGPAGARRLLVLHGGPGADHQYLLPQMLALANDYELVFIESLGNLDLFRMKLLQFDCRLLHTSGFGSLSAGPSSSGLACVMFHRSRRRFFSQKIAAVVSGG